jgi:uncharacterized protein
MNIPAPTQTSLETLKRQQFINLTTFRKNGAGVSTPVWFALADGKLLGTTQAQTGKVKRIRRNPAVTFAPCTVSGKLLGEASPGTARLLPPAEYSAANEALKRKYGLQYQVLLWMAKLRGAQEIFWEIIPA